MCDTKVNYYQNSLFAVYPRNSKYTGTRQTPYLPCALIKYTRQGEARGKSAGFPTCLKYPEKTLIFSVFLFRIFYFSLIPSSRCGNSASPGRAPSRAAARRGQRSRRWLLSAACAPATGRRRSGSRSHPPARRGFELIRPP